MITGAETREQLYVALSRGRDANHLHVVLPGAADEHAPIRRDTLLPPAAVDLLHRVLDREAAQRSATTERRALDNPTRRLREAVARYTDSLTLAPASGDAHGTGRGGAAAVAATRARLRRPGLDQLPHRPRETDHRTGRPDQPRDRQPGQARATTSTRACAAIWRCGRSRIPPNTMGAS